MWLGGLLNLLLLCGRDLSFLSISIFRFYNLCTEGTFWLKTNWTRRSCCIVMAQTSVNRVLPHGAGVLGDVVVSKRESAMLYPGGSQIWMPYTLLLP